MPGTQVHFAPGRGGGGEKMDIPGCSIAAKHSMYAKKYALLSSQLTHNFSGIDFVYNLESAY